MTKIPLSLHPLILHPLSVFTCEIGILVISDSFLQNILIRTIKARDFFLLQTNLLTTINFEMSYIYFNYNLNSESYDLSWKKHEKIYYSILKKLAINKEDTYRIEKYSSWELGKGVVSFVVGYKWIGNYTGTQNL